MRIYVVIASINKLLNITQFKNYLTCNNHEIKIVILDEGDEKLRQMNRMLLQGFDYVFYGPNERAKWFQSRFNIKKDTYMTVIPDRCHAETSFGFLVAYEERADVVVEIDDDVFPVSGYHLIKDHLQNLFNHGGVGVSSIFKWYNPIENLILENGEINIFPRGHPYSLTTRAGCYSWKKIVNAKRCVLNMGLWFGHPDLDAVTVLYYGGLDGRCKICAKDSKRNKVEIEKGTFFPVCSMNTAFVRDVIPAFYQLYMNFWGINRFDDIWSGLFLKKIADHLGKTICLGQPYVYHKKRSRDIWKDLKSEIEGIIINESLWKIVDEVELFDTDFHECYAELAKYLEKNLEALQNQRHRNFLKIQAKKMNLWLDIVDRLE